MWSWRAYLARRYESMKLYLKPWDKPQHEPWEQPHHPWVKITPGSRNHERLAKAVFLLAGLGLMPFPSLASPALEESHCFQLHAHNKLPEKMLFFSRTSLNCLFAAFNVGTHFTKDGLIQQEDRFHPPFNNYPDQAPSRRSGSWQPTFC